MKTALAIITHPFCIMIVSLILGSLFIFNNEKYAASGNVPTLFYGNWSLVLGFAFFVFGFGYVGYAIYKTIKNKKK